MGFVIQKKNRASSVNSAPENFDLFFIIIITYTIKKTVLRSTPCGLPRVLVYDMHTDCCCFDILCFVY